MDKQVRLIIEKRREDKIQGLSKIIKQKELK